ncbi:MAG: phosphotransferase [Phycisphaerales bacterium]|nr:phosphotransferase [Phycisphaerales bacterium]
MGPPAYTGLEAVALTGLREPFGRAPAAGEGASPGVISPGELARVLEHYDLGRVESARPLHKGSPEAPKLVIRTERGTFLLKRRAPQASDPVLVAAGHHVTLHLLDRDYPTPELVGTRADNNSMLQVGRAVYEMFTFVQGSPFDGSIAQAQAAGASLAHLHACLAVCHPPVEVQSGSFHASPLAQARLGAARARCSGPALVALDELELLARDAAESVDRLGYAGLSHQLIHGDWHPGNLVFDGARVASVFDFDSPRRAPRVVDLAAGALQFALAPRDHALDIDPGRLGAIVGAYHARAPLIGAERAMLAPLMVESLVVEGVTPVACTGRFGAIEADVFLPRVASCARSLRRAVEGCLPAT